MKKFKMFFYFSFFFFCQLFAMGNLKRGIRARMEKPKTTQKKLRIINKINTLLIKRKS